MTGPDPNSCLIHIPCHWTKIFNIRHMQQLGMHLNTEIEGWVIKREECFKKAKQRHPYYEYFIFKNGECIGMFHLDQQTLCRWTFSNLWAFKPLSDEEYLKALLKALKAYRVEYEP